MDESGVDCIERSRAVAGAFDPVTDSLAHCAAWLHDVLEGTPMSADDLSSAGIPSAVVAVVQSLTESVEAPAGVFDVSARAGLIARAAGLAERSHAIDPGP